MGGYRVLDTFPAFEDFWRRARKLPVSQRVESWKTEYFRLWPELFRKQAAEYRRIGADWRAVARRRILPVIEERRPLMRRARARIRAAIPVALDQCRTKLGLDFPVSFVIYVGFGCGAGWATTFAGRPAVLFGLENAVEVQWTDTRSAVAMIDHELAHLNHAQWRSDARVGEVQGHAGPWWQLYEEGFATRCEQLASGALGARPAPGPETWLRWCERNRTRLAARFLRAVQARNSVRRFFGSWYSVDGHIETGYYLGSEVIREWEARYSLREIARWKPDEVRRRARATIERMALAV